MAQTEVVKISPQTVKIPDFADRGLLLPFSMAAVALVNKRNVLIVLKSRETWQSFPPEKPPAPSQARQWIGMAK